MVGQRSNLTEAAGEFGIVACGALGHAAAVFKQPVLRAGDTAGRAGGGARLARRVAD